MAHRYAYHDAKRRSRALIPWSALLLLGAGCARPDEEDTGGADVPAGALAEPAASDWSGHYALRGTIERSRQATGSLVVDSLEPGSPRYEETAERVRRTYPTYDGPFYLARLVLAATADTTHAEFTCAHGPAATPPLVCLPVMPISGLEQASLVVEPDGDALVTGSHGEGVRIDYARLRWTVP